MPDPDDYHETLRVPLLWWPLVGVLGLSVWLAFVVATPWWFALIMGVASLAAATAGLARYGGAHIEANASEFVAGRARISWRHVAGAEALDAEATRQAQGVDADARAYLLLRGYCRLAVKVVIDDAADPAPYWLISSRRPGELAQHVNARVV